MKIYELDDYLEQNESCSDYSVFKREMDYQILIEKDYIYIPELKMNIHNAYSENYNDELKGYEIDFDFYVFFDSETKEYLYAEQGSALEVCIYNFLNVVSQKEYVVAELECEYVEQ